jgi:hypothetical protein
VKDSTFNELFPLRSYVSFPQYDQFYEKMIRKLKFRKIKEFVTLEMAQSESVNPSCSCVNIQHWSGGGEKKIPILGKWLLLMV